MKKSIYEFLYTEKVVNGFNQVVAKGIVAEDVIEYLMSKSSNQQQIIFKAIQENPKGIWEKLVAAYQNSLVLV